MAYDEKLRGRVIPYKDAGHTVAQVQEAFRVNSRSYYTWKTELEAKGKCENRYPKTREGNINREKVREMVEKHPDWVHTGIRGGNRRLVSGGG